jgi:geranylgeranyl diphosphate synthase type I
MMDDALRRVVKSVEDRLTSFFEEISKEPVSSIFEARADSLLLGQVRDLTMRGGKRLRAALLVHGAALFDAQAEERKVVWDAAAAIELLHTYFLIHDDIMDGDELRRGGPTVHVALAEEIGNRDLGVGLGVLAGDLSAALEQVLLSGIDLDGKRMQRVMRIFATMHLDVVYGQTLDMLKSASAAEVAAHKTASYTTIGPLAIGAAIAGASESETEILAKNAAPLGVAFQFSDDLLGTFGRREITGKPVGTDLRSGKQTVLLEEGLKRAVGKDLDAIKAAVGNQAATELEIRAAQDGLRSCGAYDACKQRISDLVASFIEELEKGDYLEQGKRFLIEVARFIETRED